MSKPKVHARSTRLFVNAGLRFPLCVSNAKRLNMDATRWPTEGEFQKVTCRRCRRIHKANLRRAGW